MHIPFNRPQMWVLTVIVIGFGAITSNVYGTNLISTIIMGVGIGLGIIASS